LRGLLSPIPRRGKQAAHFLKPFCIVKANVFFQQSRCFVIIRYRSPGNRLCLQVFQSTVAPSADRLKQPTERGRAEKDFIGFAVLSTSP